MPNEDPQKGLNRTMVPSEEKLEMMKDFLDCRLEPHESYFLAKNVREMVFKKPRELRRLSRMRVVTKKQLNSGLMRRVVKACKETNLRVLKTIRFVKYIYGDSELREPTLLWSKETVMSYHAI